MNDLIRNTLLLLLLALLAAPGADALPIEASVGTGPDLATIVLEFQDGADFAFEVAFDDSVPTSGVAIMQVLEAEIASFSLVILDFGFGLFIDEISYDGHTDGGFTAPDGFWHYWTRENDLDPWEFSQVGAIDRLVTDGSWDAWKWGPGSPIPEPGSGLLAGLGLAALAARRRAQSPRSLA